MFNTLRYATLAAALLAGTAAAHAQVVVADPYAPPAVVAAPAVIAPAPYVAPAPAYVAPAPVVAPAPGVVVAEPPAVSEEIVTEPAIAPPAVVTAPRETVGETVVERQQVVVPQRRVIQRRTHITRVHLTRTQRREVLRTIRYERPAPAVRETTSVSYTVGSVLPRTVPIYAMPEDIVYRAPALRGYDYTLIGNRMLVVEPGTNMVVADLY